MKILFLNDKRHDDVKNWSGTVYHIAKMLEDQGHQLYYIDNLTGNFFLRCLYRGFGILTGKQVKANREPAVLKSMAKRRDREKKQYDYDLIFAPVGMCLCYLDDEKPSVMYVDATYGGMEGFYPNFTSVSARTARNGNFHEKMALETCTKAIFASEWAKQTAIDCYGIEESKLEVVNFGANVSGGVTDAELEDVIASRAGQQEKLLLFVGVDWARKGGPKALEAVKLLAKKGWSVKLAIVGCRPQLTEEEKAVTEVYGFLDKNNEEQARLLQSLYRRAWLFFMPSLYECAGIVYAEAAAFGLPSLAADAGGVSAMVIDRESGRLLPQDADSAAYASLIEGLLKDPQGYEALCRSTLACSHRLFTWESVGKRVNQVLEAAAAAGGNQ